jgi:hypothetical protein
LAEAPFRSHSAPLAVERRETIAARDILGGLHHQYCGTWLSE